MGEDPGSPVIVRPGEGARVHGLDMVRKVDAGSFDGRLLVVEGRISPGELLPPHTHTREDECSYVVSGQATFQVGEHVVAAAAGSYVLKPRGVPHAVWNSGTEPARVMEVHVPATFARYYDEVGAILADPAMGETERREALAAHHARYGVTFHWDRVAALAERYGVVPQPPGGPLRRPAPQPRGGTGGSESS
ncbi:cupin domain-containing protein [Geodermatophilus marinus]|uniref:cupin domain-containing protein n=1 Tax=Geodermatophilus sp. LHW52908 TaxID=2303986 RepID=UPI000E3CBB2E|nr:cupin domain-containing protein [Geodermatophilus sp. LHW52908]RFU20705.1 cupin domain-containing protein [Geodermatophilus sp. LHW52908]